MSYELAFDRRALKDWHKLDEAVRQQFKRKLSKVLENPHVPASRLHGLPDCYKIKLRSLGYRLVYQVLDSEVLVFVVAVGKREGGEVYGIARERME